MTIYNAPGVDYDAHLSYGGTSSVVTTDELPTFMLKATDKTGASSLLPKAKIDNMSFEASNPGAIKLTVAEGTIGYAQCAEYTRIDLLMNGLSVRDGSWLLRDSDYKEGVRTKVKSWTGITYMWDRLSNAVVWKDTPVLKYDLKTIGFILNDLFVKAQARGGLEDLTWTFNATTDSLGNAWPQQLIYEFKASLQYSEIVLGFVQGGGLEIWQQGNEIVCAVGDRPGLTSPALLVVGKDITDAPQKTSAQNVAGHILIVSEDETIISRDDAAVDAKFGYRDEKSITAGGTSTPTLEGDAALANGNDVRVQRTYNVVMNPDRKWFPLRDYNIEQYVRVEHGASLVQLRVKQITLQVASGGIMSAGIVLNDKLLDLDLKIARALKGLQTGKSIAGSSRPSPGTTPDTTTPSKVTGLTLASGVYQNEQGITKAYFQAAWAPVTTNTDSSSIDDLASYNLAWWYADRPFTSHVEVVLASSDLEHIAENLDPNRTVNVYVYTKDQSGHQGSWSDIETILLSADTIPPNQPSTPTVKGLLKQVVVTWDGLDVAGQPMAPDTRGVRVYINNGSPFDPDANNKTDGVLAGFLPQRGDVSVSGLAIGDNCRVRFVAIDLSGNLSTPSAEVTQTVSGVSGADINSNTILANNIGAGQINAVHIKAGQVTTDKVTLGQTENLVQDPGFADAGFRARRLTTEFTEKPGRWFFKINSVIQRSGYLLQMLSQSPVGEEQGKMWITDWMNVQMGEIYFAAATVRNGEFSPNADARFHLGYDVEYRDGSVDSDYLEYDPDLSWTKVQYQLPMQPDWGKLRFWMRPWNMISGDIAVDDLEVRCAVGTTALDGPRGQLTPLGLNAWDVFDNKTVEIDFSTGNAFLRGGLRSGETGKRLDVNPGASYLPEIRFYPSNAEVFSYLNAFDDGGPGTFPLIGLNAPDTGGTGVALILADNGFKLGEINKAGLFIAGPGIFTTGSGAGGALELYGKFPGNPGTTLGAMYSNKYVVAANNTGLTMSKIGTPASGEYLPFYGLWRNTTTLFQHHMNSNTSASWTVLFTLHATLATVVHEQMLRMG